MNESERVKALADHLDCDVEDLEETGYRENVYALNPRREKQGKPPSYYLDIIEKFKTLLTTHKINQITEFIQSGSYYMSLPGNRDKLYYPIAKYLKRYKTDKPEYKEIKDKSLYVENVLYHLLSHEDKDFVKSYQSAFLGLPVEDNREYRSVDSGEYMILTDEEADQEARDYIESSLWAFNAWFIVDHSVLPNRNDTIELIQGYQEDKCEDANDTIKSLIKDLDEFVEDAISSDGRAHFINTYDGRENEIQIESEDPNGLPYQQYFYIYRVG